MAHGCKKKEERCHSPTCRGDFTKKKWGDWWTFSIKNRWWCKRSKNEGGKCATFSLFLKKNVLQPGKNTKINSRKPRGKRLKLVLDVSINEFEATWDKHNYSNHLIQNVVCDGALARMMPRSGQVSEGGVKHIDYNCIFGIIWAYSAPVTPVKHLYT